jgi:glycosyltransferase involved in cell wall biosynthesis
MHHPRITIVTPSFNQGPFLEATIQSILGQNYPNLEYIIMDGGSRDNSVDIIRKYEKQITYWQSGPDQGQSDAICQGFGRATGDILNWINSDDLLAPGALQHIAELYAENPRADVFAASTEHFTDNPSCTFTKKTPKGWSPASFLGTSGSRDFVFNQPGVFFTRKIYETIGGINKDLHICMDFDMFLRICEQDPVIAYSNRTTALFRHHGGSKTTGGSLKNSIREQEERLRIYDAAEQRTGLTPDRKRHFIILFYIMIRSLFRLNFKDARMACRAITRYGYAKLAGAGAAVFFKVISRPFRRLQGRPPKEACP